ncbi:hypothetical protein BFL43_04255 [Williamsia sp. 1135]|nr:hypothetical protein BFL43_04255 [Williamsia sp. 1135]
MSKSGNPESIYRRILDDIGGTAWSASQEIVSGVETAVLVRHVERSLAGSAFAFSGGKLERFSGYFSRELHSYGREGLPCHRCGALIRREAFMNRSSFVCRKCQRPPRQGNGTCR